MNYMALLVNLNNLYQLNVNLLLKWHLFILILIEIVVFLN